MARKMKRETQKARTNLMRKPTKVMTTLRMSLGEIKTTIATRSICRVC